MGHNRRSPLDEDLSAAFEERSRQLHVIAARAGREEAADLVQDAFVRALEADRREPVDNPLHFLRRIARNVVIDRLRARGRKAQVFSPQAAPDIADAAINPERSLVAAERLRRVLAIIDAMPGRRREVFVMHRFEHLTHHQIARQLNISIKAVEKHIGLAMTQISRELGAD